jgi:hypothetical protein
VARIFKRALDSGEVKNRAAIALHTGVSRAPGDRAVLQHGASASVLP